jgi:hypothetical protein
VRILGAGEAERARQRIAKRVRGDREYSRTMPKGPSLAWRPDIPERTNHHLDRGDLALGHAHHDTLHRVFAHPMDMNIHWREIVKMFEDLGGSTDETHHGRLKVKLGDHERSFRIPHHSHSLDSRDELVEIRHFLEAAGHKPAS